MASRVHHTPRDGVKNITSGGDTTMRINENEPITINRGYVPLHELGQEVCNKVKTVHFLGSSESISGAIRILIKR